MLPSSTAIHTVRQSRPPVREYTIRENASLAYALQHVAAHSVATSSRRSYMIRKRLRSPEEVSAESAPGRSMSQ